MKNKLSLILFFLTTLAYAQSQQLINYQGIVRGVDGAPVLNQAIGIQFEILQTSATGSVVFTETQAITTNSLGLIVTKIGSSNSLSAINWQNGPYFLRVSADVQGGNNYEVLSTQQIVGVPLSFHASTVPGAYTASTNVLNIGGNTFTLASTPNTTLVAQGIATATTITTNSIVLDVPAPTFSANGPVTITGAYPSLTVNSPPVTTVTAVGVATVNSSGINSFEVGVPQPTFTSNGPVTVSGAYPNMTVSAPPTPTVSGSGIVGVTSPANGAFVVAVPQTSITVTNTAGTGGVSGVGTNSFNINIPAGVTPTLVGAGVASVGPSTVGNSFVVTVPQTSIALTQTGTANAINAVGINSFNINMAPPSILGQGAASVTSSGFNYSVAVPPVAITVGGALQSITGGINQFTLNAPQTQLTVNGAALLASPGTNSFSVYVPPTVINPGGAVAVTALGTNTFNVSVPISTITQSGAAIVTSAGTNSFNINVPATSLNTSGAISVVPAGTNTFNITVPQTTLTQSGAAVITSAGTNSFNINVPTSTITQSGAAIVTSAGTNTFNINVPATSLNTSGAISVVPAGTNTFNITVPQTTLTQSGAAVVTSAGTNSFNINVPTSTITQSGAAIVTSAGTNTFNINVPATSLNTSGAITVVPAGTNTFNITVPQTTLTQSGAAVVTSAGTNSFNINVPTSTITQSGAAIVTSAGTNSFNINVPPSSVSVTSIAGAVGFTNTGTNSVVINVPPAITPTISPAGLANVNTSGNSFTVNVPLLTYTAATGALASGTNSINITPPIALNANILSVGPTSNSVALSNLTPWRQAVGAVTLATIGDRVGIGTNAPTANLQVESAANTSLSILSGGANTSDLFFGTSAITNRGRIRFDNASSALSLWTTPTATSAAMTINSLGQAIIGNNLPFASTTGLTISRNGAFNNQLTITGGDNNNTFGGVISFAENLNYVAGMSLKLDAGSNRLVFTNDLTGTNPVVGIGGYSGTNLGMLIGTGYAGGINPPADGLLVQGNLGVGSINPGTKLEVIGDISIPNGNKVVFGTVSSGSGIGEWIQNSVNGLQLNTASVPRINITTGGNVGIGTTTPVSPLHVFGATTLEGNVSIGTSAITPSDARVYGSVRMGTETGTSQGPSYPFGSGGLITRRVFNSDNVNIGSVMARTDQMTFERDGTNSGFRINNTGGSGNEVCNCTGVTSSGAPINKAFNNLGLTTTTIYSNADNVVFFHCMFGDPFNLGHITEIRITREAADFYWVGTITSTFNQ